MSGLVVIIDYGMGNIHSIYRKLDRLKQKAMLTSNAGEIAVADKIILPGVGHFQNAMDNLNKLGLCDVLNEEVLVKRKPILGICLGMQLMAEKSEEGNSAGLGWIKGEVTKFKVKDPLTHKIPHIGWNQALKKKNSVLLNEISDSDEFYFVHSYHMQVVNQEDVLSETEYDYSFVSAIEKNNIFGVQYHPEKSHDCGERLLKNFISI